jgi:hypothetical protein
MIRELTWKTPQATPQRASPKARIDREGAKAMMKIMQIR